MQKGDKEIMVSLCDYLKGFYCMAQMNYDVALSEALNSKNITYSKS